MKEIKQGKWYICDDKRIQLLDEDMNAYRKVGDENKPMYQIQYGKDFVQINRMSDKREVCCWVDDEWKENPSVVLSICKAIELADKNQLEDYLKKGGKL